MRWVEILRAEEDTIDWEILDWADARDLWDEHYDKSKYFSVVADILSKCSSVEVTSEQYDHDAPGRSGLECPSSNALRPICGLANGVSSPSAVKVKLRFGDASSGDAGWSCA